MTANNIIQQRITDATSVAIECGVPIISYLYEFFDGEDEVIECIEMACGY